MISLNVHTCYSFLDSNIRINEYINKIKKLHEDYASITDINNMFGVMEFVKVCKNNDIKPIIGMELSLNNNEEVTKLILLAKNTKGYHNLLKITELINPNLTLDNVSAYLNNLIVIIPTCRSHIGLLVLKNEIEQAKAELSELLKYTPYLYMGMEAYNKNDVDRLQTIRKAKLGVKLVAINEVCSITSSNEELKIERAIKDNVLLEDVDVSFAQKYLKTEADISSYCPMDEIKNTYEVASLIENYEFDRSIKLIKYNENSKEYLKSLAVKGLNKRLNNNVPKEYKERLTYELGIIDSMGYNDYFLVVYDYVKFAKTHDIIVGPGRGSGGGSLVAYVLGITDIDPIRYDLYFERFLNPGRTSLPDIDVDFEDRRRDEVVAYLQSKWGADHVANIATFQTFGIKQAIRDVCRVLGVSSATMNAFAKKIPMSYGISTDNILELSTSFKEFVESNEQYKKIFELASSLEGLPRQMSLHAAGVIITDKPISDYVPTVINDGNYICEYEHDYLEDLGLFKMDLLGLKNITIINDCLKEIRKTRPDFKLTDIDFNDPKLYEALNKNLMAGIFQLESSGMRKTLLSIKPDCFDDVAATIALFRPGPRDFIPTYIKRKSKQEKVTYWDPCLEPILKSTYGIIIYQEQVLAIARAMAGFSYGEADIFRRIISKKDPTALASIHEEFINKGLKNGKPLKLLEEIFTYLSKFAGYGFNKAHTVGYTYIALQMTYLKVYYPSIFYSCLMNNFIGISMNNKFFEYIGEAQSLGVKILPPSINASSPNFYNVGKDIRFGLASIKGVTASFVKEILEENQNPFIDYIDFVVRMKAHGLNENIASALIYSGALDEFKLNRSTMLNNLNRVLNYADRIIINDKEKYFVDYDLASKPKLDISNEPNDLEKEKEVLGTYLSDFPLTKEREKYSKAGYSLVSNLKNGKQEKIVVLIRNIRTIKDKNKNLMAMIKASDESGDIDLTLFASSYNSLINEFEVGKYAYVTGKVEVKDRINMIINNAKMIGSDNK